MSSTMSLRLAVGGIIHETNTFATECLGTTPLSAFEQYDGAEIVEAFTGSNHQVGGFIDGARKHGAEIAWTFLGQATPSGTIAGLAYAAMKQALLSRLREALPIDGVLLALHGAGVAEGIDDIEGDLAAAVREVVGPGTPIAAAYDLHSNVTPQMIESCDITLPCRLYPHTDFNVRAVQAVDLLVRVIAGDLRPVTRMVQPPMLQYIVPTTAGFLPNEINRRCEDLSAISGVEDCSWFHGFPLSDIAMPGPTALCLTNGDAGAAERCATDLATWVWERRERFRPDLLTPQEGVRLGCAFPGPKPFVIADYADNPGGGTPGDGTQLLRAMIEADLTESEACFSMIADPAVVRQAIDAGVGKAMEVSLGGKRGARQGEPIRGQAHVMAVTEGRYTCRPRSMFAGVRFDVGPMCWLRIRNVDVLVSSRAEQMYDDEPFRLHGLDIQNYRIVGIKGANHFRAGYEPLSGRMITVDGGGLSSADLTTFARQLQAKPLWPLQDVAFEPVVRRT